ncbi:MAG TPA: glutamate 5-kinase [Anaerolineaceae bacterium]|nr:glutamate 5-kinase [Anaerolineaceae bacterium]
MRYRRIVVKIGTSTLTQGTHCLQYPRIVEFARQIKHLQDQDYQIVLVSSGAIAAGREVLNFPALIKHVPAKQMLAAVGQPRLMAIYEQIFSMYGIKVGQVLLTRTDITNRKSYINARGTLEALLEQGIIPIVNENDTIATDEIGIGDNDSLSAMVATILEADLLLLLTDIEGLYDGDPNEAKSSLIREIRSREIPSVIWEAVRGSSSDLGTGGMLTKLQAAEVARRSGTTVVITDGSVENILLRIAGGETPGTWIFPVLDKLESRKRYLLACALKNCGVQIDKGALLALKKGGSLLPVGVTATRGAFQRGDAIYVFDPSGKPCAMGRCTYGSDEIDQIKGLHTDRIEQILGYIFSDEMIHHDDMILLLKGGEEDE